MSALTREKLCGGTALAIGALAMTAMLSGPAYADGMTATPIQGRTEGGSIILNDGDIVACAGVGDLRVVDTKGTEHLTDGAGTTFTTPAGTKVVTLRHGTVEVTVKGASAEITCGSEGFPTTNARVPKGPSLAGAGGSVSGVDAARTVGGGALVLVGGAAGAFVLRRRANSRT